MGVRGQRGGLERRLHNREAGRRRIGERQRDRSVVIELHDARDRDQGRIETAGAGRDDEVSMLERIAPDFERALWFGADERTLNAGAPGTTAP